MRDAILRKVGESAELATSFFTTCAPQLERVARLLAESFERGGRLYVMGNGGSACDAMHVAVEFQHPIIEKRRALPAASLVTDAAQLTAVANDGDFAQVFATQLARVTQHDAVLGISTSGTAANVLRGIRVARERGALTIAFTGRDGGPLADTCHHAFVVPSWSIHRIQETHVILLHVLWDQLHVALGEDDVL